MKGFSRLMEDRIYFFFLEFAGKVELDMLKIHLSHLENIITVGKEDIPSITVFCHILILTFFESLQFFDIITFYPTRLIKADGLPTAFCIVFVFQTILDNLKLQLSYCTDNLTSIKLIDKQLSYTLIHQLVDTFCQLFLLHRVGILDIFKHFRRKTGNTPEM